MFEITDNELNELREKYIGKVMTVEELADKLPRLWVVIEIVERGQYDRLSVLSGRLIEVVKDDEADQLVKKYMRNTYVRTMRTTCGTNTGYVSGVCFRVE